MLLNIYYILTGPPNLLNYHEVRPVHRLLSSSFEEVCRYKCLTASQKSYAPLFCSLIRIVQSSLIAVM